MHRVADVVKDWRCRKSAEFERMGLIRADTMGKPMTKRVLGTGLSVTVYDVSPVPVSELAGLGASTADSPKAVAKEPDIITMLRSSRQVEALGGSPESGFMIDLVHRDLTLAGGMATARGVLMPVAALRRGLSGMAQRKGPGRRDFTSLLTPFEE